MSGGGIWGAAHIGVLRYIEEKEATPTDIIGCSAGAIVGAFYAFGHTSGDIFNKFEIFANRKKWVHYSKSDEYVTDFQKVRQILKGVFGDKKMSDAKIPLKIVATDYDTGEPKVFSEEFDNVHVVDAILSTMSIPGVFPHVTIDNKMYVDGFMSSNLPIEYSSNYFLSNIKIPGRKIVAVDLMSEKCWKLTEKHNYFFFGKLRNIITEAERAVYVMIHNQTKTKLKAVKNIVLLKPDIMNISLLHPKGWEKMVELGYQEAIDKLSE